MEEGGGRDAGRERVSTLVLAILIVWEEPPPTIAGKRHDGQ